MQHIPRFYRITTILILLTTFVTVPAYAAGTPPVLSVADTTTYGAGTAPVIVAPTLTITDDDTEMLDGVRVNLDTNFAAATDRLGISGQGTATSGTVSGLSWNYNATTGVLTISGNASTTTYQSVLRQVTFYTVGAPALNARSVQFTLGSSLANPGNGHFYAFISQSGVSWSASRTAAATNSLFGLQGYLVTITSAAEMDFIQSKVAGNGWIGATDEVSEGDWRWVTGPEAGTAFWLGTASGTPVNGAYNHWGSGEPNNAGGEDYAHVLGNPAFGDQIGFWNDLPNAGGGDIFMALGYLVEYGGMAGDPTLQITGTATVQVVDATADLAVTISDSADPVGVGTTYTYVVTVTNNGPNSATSVSTSMTLSGASATILSASASQGACSVSAPTVSCALGTLAASASATITITVEPNATGTVTANATVSASEPDPASGNNSASQSTTITNGLGCTITGTPGNDTLYGTNGADVICGLGGNDTIYGYNGADTIYAGSGNDLMNGGNHDDTMYGGPGDDSSYGEDLLGLLDNGADVLYGGPGNDTLDGQNGNDMLIDTDGTDRLSGSNGNDTIVTQDGVGGDTANGGLGSDTCTVDGSDTTSGC